MSSEEKVFRVVENSAKIVVPSVENDESSTVENDIQFEIPSAEVGLYKNEL